MKKVTRRLRNYQSVIKMNEYLYDHFLINDFALRVTIEKWSPKRSLGQNALMHVWFDEIGEQVGDTGASVKEDLKGLLAPKVEGPLGVMRAKGTSEMSTPEASDFMTQVQVMAAEYGWELTQA